MSGLILIQSVCHSDSIPERIYRKFEKKSADNKKKSMKNFPGGKELICISTLIRVTFLSEYQ